MNPDEAPDLRVRHTPLEALDQRLAHVSALLDERAMAHGTGAGFDPAVVEAVEVMIARFQRSSNLLVERLQSLRRRLARAIADVSGVDRQLADR